MNRNSKYEASAVAGVATRSQVSRLLETSSFLLGDNLNDLVGAVGACPVVLGSQ